MSTVLQKSFSESCDTAKMSTKTISNQIKLEMYALYKQATEGNIQGERPGFFSQVARAKWDAWDMLKEVTSENAMQKYIEYVNREL